MKTNLLICITILISVLCTSCSKEESFTSINLLSNTADLVVINQTTGSSTKNHHLPLDVNNGDEIKIVYTPKDEY